MDYAIRAAGSFTVRLWSMSYRACAPLNNQRYVPRVVSDSPFAKRNCTAGEQYFLPRIVLRRRSRLCASKFKSSSLIKNYLHQIPKSISGNSI